MENQGNSGKISRKDALKRLGGLAAGLPLGMSSLSFNTLTAPKEKKETAFPFIKKNNIKGKPNILWITTEGVPLRVLSCYGSAIMQTPNIDRIAKEGMQFQNSFCNNALCAPSRATLLTGKYNHLNGQLTNPEAVRLPGQPESFFNPQQETFSRILQKNGYKTGIAGKWHLESGPGTPANPGEAGFDYFVFKKGAGGPYYEPKGFFQNPSLGSKKIVETEHKGYITDVFTDLSIKGMDELRKSGKPFFFAVQYFNAHRFFQPPHEYAHLYDQVHFPEPGTFWDDYKHRSAAADKAHMRIADMLDFNPPKDFNSRQRQQWNYQMLMRHFLGALKRQDDNIGRLLEYLDQNGLADNTIVVFTGDHGFFLGEHGWFDKRFMYEPSIRVPWLIRYPGVTNPGSHSNAWVQTIDDAPTILDMAGLPVPPDMQGKSLMPLFRGNTPEGWPDSLYYHYYEFSFPHWVLPHYGIRTDRYKLISYYTINEWELFDLERDPDEMDSLMIQGGMDVKAGYEDILKDLLTQLKELRKKYKDDTGMPVKFWPRGMYN